MKLRSTVTIPGAASVDMVDEVVAHLSELGAATADIKGRRIIFTFETTDIPDGSISELAQDIAIGEIQPELRARIDPDHPISRAIRRGVGLQGQLEDWQEFLRVRGFPGFTMPEGVE